MAQTSKYSLTNYKMFILRNQSSFRSVGAGPNVMQDDPLHAVLAAVGYNFRRLIRWLTLLLRQILIALTAALQPVPI